MNSKNIWKYGFNWGSIIGGIYFLYRLLGNLLNFETSLLWSFLGLLIILFGLVWAMINYKRNVAKENLKFGKYFSIGAIMSLFMSLFLTLFMALYITKLNPTYLDDFLLTYQDFLDASGNNINIIDNPKFIRAIEIAFLPFSYVFSFLGYLFYVLIIALLLSYFNLGNTRRSSNTSSNNDYIPYQEIKEEKSEEDIPENEIESSKDENSEKEDN
jgi:hypothetical protein